MNALLDGKTAVVTGGASGIGRSVARTFASEGASVVVADVREEPRQGGRPTVDLITEETETDATFVNCDVTTLDDIDDVMDVAADFGGIDILFNGAAIIKTEQFLDTTIAEYKRTMGVNLKGTYFTCQRAARQMIEIDTHGSIINMSSLAGMFGRGSVVSYSVSKGGVKLLTYSLADFLGQYDIRVNAIHPGVTDTAMVNDDVPLIGTDSGTEYLEGIPLSRFGTTQDVANVALFLASELAEFVNGESIVVDGGKSHT